MRPLDSPPLSSLVPSSPGFRTAASVADAIQNACDEHPDVVSWAELGRSEDGRPIHGLRLGRGPVPVSLLAGCHADEPVGPETLRTLTLGILADPGPWRALLEAVTLWIVPHINPDGEARNQPWIRRWPSAEAFFGGVQREKPGRDVEFGFPALRVENEVVSAWWRTGAPFALHLSLHGMACSEGALLLIERHWAGARTAALRTAFRAQVEAAGLPLHDHNREGEKGFFYIARGFTTTPEGAAMQAHFKALGDLEMAARFRSSSMEYIRTLGGDPLCLVTELPLFLLPASPQATPGVPEHYLAFKERLPEQVARLRLGESGVGDELAHAGVRPLDLGTAMRLQLATIELGLRRVLTDGSSS
ncbi:MAG: M14 family zinc carboxypeptidase [Bacteroidota bacterium]